MPVNFIKSKASTAAAIASDTSPNITESAAAKSPESPTAQDACTTKAKVHWLNSASVSAVVDGLERARRALFALDPSCDYDTWFTIACAAKEAGLIFADFHKWSAGGHSYKGNADCLNLWKTIEVGKPNGITKWRLLKLAIDAGWNDPNPDGDFGGPQAPEQSLDQQALQYAEATAEHQSKSHALEQRFASYPNAPDNHQYIAKKHGYAKGLRTVPDADSLKISGKAVAGWLAVPCRALDGTLHTIQYIAADGTKLNTPGAGFADGMFVDGVIAPTGRIYVVEGIAKAWAVRDADYEAAAAVSFGAGRFSTVAKALRAAHPTLQIILVPDRGKEDQAKNVAAEVGGYWVELPQDKPSNYGVDDFKIEYGAIALRKPLHDLKTPQVQQDYEHLIDRSDTGNANLFAELTGGNLRFVSEQRLWIHWDGAKWLVDHDGGIAQQYALRVAEHYRAKAEVFRSESTKMSNDDRKRLEKLAESHSAWAVQCRNKHRLTALLDIAGKFPHIGLSLKRMDTDPRLLGVANGVVDLRTGELRPAARDDFVTRRSPLPFNPAASAPKWLKFIEQITGSPIPPQTDAAGNVVTGTVGLFKPRPALADYLHRALGYSLTGLTEQHKLFVCVGGGSNGKNVLLDIVRWALGDYGLSLPSTMLLESKGSDDVEKASPNSARLAGARCAISSENKEGQKFAVATIKRHTGDTMMTARFLHGNPFEFEISHKLWMMTNAVPTIDHLDGAIKGRLHFIPFDRQWNRPGETDKNPLLPNGDERLFDDLKMEGPGILAWLVAGAVEYEKGEKDRLVPPAEVVNMTRSYFNEQDVLGKWLAQYERCAPKEGTPAKALLESLHAWCADEGIDGGKFNATSFRNALASRQIGKHKTSAGILYGLRLLPKVASEVMPDTCTCDEVDYSEKL